MPELSIIIPTKDRGVIFFKTLEKVIESTAHRDTEIIIINNSVTPLMIPSLPVNVMLYDNPNNKESVFSARNYGAGIARSPLLLFIDDDIIISKESIDYVITFHTSHAHGALNPNWEYPPELKEKLRNTVFGRYLIKHGFTSMRTLFGRSGWQNNAPFLSPSIASFFFSILKDDFIKIGGYDERHLHEGTDADISNRLIKNGIEIWINPLLMVYHNEADRTEIINWLERKKRLGAIHGNSANMEDYSHPVHYSFMKRAGFSLIYKAQPLLLRIIKQFDNTGFDSAGFFLINALLGANMCEGYYSVRKMANS
jgi:GT2 family glycosyltransferase